MNILRTASISLAGIAIAVGAAACNSPHNSAATSDHHITASQSATAKDLTKCLPTGGVQQIELIKSLSSQSGRDALISKCGIPAKNKTAFEAGVLTAAESGHLNTSSGRSVFFNDTVPQLIEKYQA